MVDNQILIIGDIHGQFVSLINKLRVLDIRDCILISVGDWGYGFSSSPTRDYENQKMLNEFFVERNIQCYVIRGNHDDPVAWKGKSRIVFSNLEFLEDYTVKEFNGEKFLFVGGAVSIDRRLRKEGVSYWIDEVFKLDESKVSECDVLVVHTAPSWIGPFDKEGLSGWCEKDPTLWDECLEERRNMNKLFKLAKPKRSYHGHFHISTVVDFDDCWARILNEFEIYEHRKSVAL